MHEATRLGWVHAGLDGQLEGAREALGRAAAREPTGSALAEAAAPLGRVARVLELLQIGGAFLLAEELALLARAAGGAGEGAREEVLELLYTGLLRLAGMLAGAQSGAPAHPLAIVPLLDDLRAARGGRLVSGGAVLGVRLQAPLPRPQGRQPEARSEEAVRGALRALRTRFQRGLVDWYRGGAGGAAAMTGALHGVGELAAAQPQEPLWWVAGMLTARLDAGTIGYSPGVKRLLARLDAELKALGARGQAGLAAAPPRDLLRSLLLHGCQDGHWAGAPQGPCAAFGLPELLPARDDAAPESGLGSRVGFLETALEALQAEVSDLITLLGSPEDAPAGPDAGPPGERERVLGVLDGIADALGLLGLGALRRRLTALSGSWAGSWSGSGAYAPDTALAEALEVLVAVQGALLDAANRRFEELLDPESQLGCLSVLEAGFPGLRAAVAAELGRELEALREHLLAHLRTPRQGIRLVAAGGNARRLRGALTVLGLEPAAAVAGRVERLVRDVLASQAPALPPEPVLDAAAEAVAALGWYLEEALGASREASPLLRRAQAAAARLPLPPEVAVDEAGAEIEEVALAAPPEPEPPAAPGVDGMEETELAVEEISCEGLPGEEPEPQGEESLPPALAASLQAAGERFRRLEGEPRPPVTGAFVADVAPVGDPELVAVLAGEAAALAGVMAPALQAWQEAPGDAAPLADLGEALHTLKSASRLAGAVLLGDLAWALGTLLDEAARRGAAERAALLPLVRDVHALLPAYVEASATGLLPPEAADLRARITALAEDVDAAHAPDGETS